MSTTDILFPVGRLVMGSLYKPQDRDMSGAPLTIKTGPNAGQPTVRYFFAVAIPKGGTAHWNQTEWGKQIYAIGQAAFPQGQANAPTFAWKIVDGDSNVPNRKGRKPCESEGHPGNWIVSFSSTFAPKVYNSDGSAPIVEEGAVKLGYFVEVLGSVAGNDNATNPGVYVNHKMIALSAYGPEIQVGPDAAAVGFGGKPLPAGASAAPTAAMTPPAVPGAPVAPSVPAAAPAAPVAPPTVVTPHPGFMAPPVPPAAPAAPPSGPVWKGPPGSTQAAYAAAGWTEAQMRQEGLLA
jgi:hypothetical protein